MRSFIKRVNSNDSPLWFINLSASTLKVAKLTSDKIQNKYWISFTITLILLWVVLWTLLKSTENKDSNDCSTPIKRYEILMYKVFTVRAWNVKNPVIVCKTGQMVVYVFSCVSYPLEIYINWWKKHAKLILDMSKFQYGGAQVDLTTNIRDLIYTYIN